MYTLQHKQQWYKYHETKSKLRYPTNTNTETSHVQRTLVALRNRTGVLCIHRTLRSHNTAPEKLTDNPKPIPRALQLRLEQVMLTSSVNLSLTNGPKRSIARCTDRTLHVILDAVETAFVERVLAEEMHGGKIEGTAAGLAATRLKDYWLCRQRFEFLLFGSCFGFVA